MNVSCNTCKWKKDVAGHPWNKHFNGHVGDVIGYVCTTPEMEHFILFETLDDKGGCEVWDPK